LITHGIITAPRPQSTLGASLTSLRSAGFDGDVLVSSDDPAIKDIPNTIVQRNQTPQGNFRNWMLCLRTMLQYSLSPWLCISEDDVSWVPNCRPILEHDLGLLEISGKIRRVGALSLYFPIAMSSTIEGGKLLDPGWYEATRGIKTWGAQCFLFSRKMATELITSPHMMQYEANEKWTKNVDGIVADVLAKHSLSILYRVPCLVNHDLGEGNSSLGYPDSRPKLKTRYFTGQA
jgi:hypothetical protein